MKAKDNFIDWLREKILENPQEPPQASWQNISDDLDFEESWLKIGEELEINSIWEKIDHRLHNFNLILKYERLGYVMSAAVVFLFFLNTYLLNPSFSDQLSVFEKSSFNKHPRTSIYDSSERVKSIAGKAIDPISSQIKISQKPAFEVPKALIDLPKDQFPFSPFSSGNRKSIAARAEEELRNQAYQSINSSIIIPIGSARGFIFNRTHIETLEVNNAKKFELAYFQEVNPQNPGDYYPTQYMGAGSALKMNWFLNNKTLYALERSSLITALPAYEVDWNLVYGLKIKNRLFLQTEFYLKDKVGQAYKEYRNGQYGLVKDQLKYRSLSLAISYVNKQVGGGKYPTFSRWTGGLYGGQLQNAVEMSQLGEVNNSSDYAKYRLGAIAGYEYDTFLSEKFVISYGIRSRMDLFNIYAGTENIPAELKRTRALSIDFSFSFKYLFNK